MKSQYLLPGERDPTSSIVHTHGTITTKQQFLSIPRIYEPKERDLVIGVVIVRAPDLFLVDINSRESAILPLTAFDNGRIPPRNAMNRFSVVYARVVRTEPWTHTELSCQSSDSSKKKSDFGLISEGNILRCSLALCQKLQQSKLLDYLKKIIKNFEIRVTRNGFIWYQVDTTNSMIAVKNVLYRYEVEDNPDRLIDYYQTLMNQLQQQDDNLVKLKQTSVKKEMEEKKSEVPPPPVVNKSKSTAVDRLLTDVVRNVIGKIIDQIEENEKN